MARPNQTLILSDFVNILPTFGRGFVPYSCIADRMDCSIEEARNTIWAIAMSEADALRLSFYMLEPEDVESILKEAGVNLHPMLKEACADGGVVIEDGFDFLSQQPRLNVEESQALLSALDYCHVPDDSELRDKLLQNAMPKDMNDELQLQHYVSSADDSELMRDLSLLCGQGRLCTIEYAAESSSTPGGLVSAEPQTRTIAPLRLHVGENDEVYLTAYCYLREALREFKVSRIVNLEPSAKHAAPEIRKLREQRPTGLEKHSEEQIARLKMPQSECIDPRVWIDAQEEDGPDGTKIVSVPMHANNTWLVKNIVARLGRVQVLEPQSLASDVATYARELQQQLQQLAQEFEAQELEV